MWLAPHFDAADNLLRFDRFMERALYDPEHGYYGARLRSIGRTADFSTTPTLSPILARSIAAWIREQRPRHVIEIGAGGGELAAGIRKALPLLTRRRLTYHIVERSPTLRETQERLLGRAVHWHHDPASALAAAGGQACLFSNELLDAFPVRVFQRGGGPTASWRELHLILAGDEIQESFLPIAPTDLPGSTLFRSDWPAGQRLEVHESVRQWLTDWLPSWQGGEMLTIDYGGAPAEIYHRRPAGTLRAYLHHQRLTGPALYQNPGHQDLTADLNFDDLTDWGDGLGLETVSCTTQRDFLLPHARSTHAEHFLLDPAGAGSAFKVLRQRRS